MSFVQDTKKEVLVEANDSSNGTVTEPAAETAVLSAIKGDIEGEAKNEVPEITMDAQDSRPITAALNKELKVSESVTETTNGDEPNEREAENKAEPSENTTEGPKQEVDFLDNILKEAETNNNTASVHNDSDGGDSLSSSSEESSDDSSSENSSSEDENEEEAAEVADSDGEDEASGKPITSKNEVVDEPAPSLPDDFIVDPSDPIEEIGTVTGAVEKSIIIKGNISGEFRFLKEGSVLCLEDRTPLGYIFEIFGPLAHPLYRIKFNTEEEMKKFGEIKDKKVFYVVPKSNFVYTDSIKAMKGSDASNWNDEEIPEEEQDFSDDEKEMESKKNKNKKKRSRKNKDESDADKDQAIPSKIRGRPKQDRMPQRNFQRQDNYQQRPQAEANPSFGYQSRSQREQQQQQPQVHQNNHDPNIYYQVPPAMFQPPPQMAPVPFPFPGQVPVSGFTPNMNPQQWQQFYQMQQMMMQQMYAAQQGQFPPHHQQNQQNPPGSNGH